MLATYECVLARLGIPTAKGKTSGEIMNQDAPLLQEKPTKLKSGRSDISRTVRRPAGVEACETEPVKVAELPFALDALEPLISREAMHFHYDKHFKGYVNKLNALVVGSAYAELPLEDIVRQAAWKRKRPMLVNASQTWNHAFFWQCLQPGGVMEPDVILSEAIRRTFGSYADFEAKFVEKGVAHVGSGWLWLACHPERGLIITATEDAIPVWLASGRVPLLVCDLWEHAYYLDWRHDRAGWLKGFLAQAANWNFAGEQLASVLDRREPWTYCR
ncbi:superoxide dismutase [Novosphingobium sp. G106]|uniref:superoxide dismutase n=1 Tax=Novosphingobium sp. G106 TaxID=2849500 RepID=UPI001C2D6EFB|nr:superoxide dismutase [Novosphingobium sp. G106]MBV1691353.1 superoxide dismutase [Novosphingobium sp. G106]